MSMSVRPPFSCDATINITMNSPIMHDFHQLDMLSTLQKDDCDMMPAGSTSHLPIEMLQWLGDARYDERPNVYPPDEDFFSSYLAVLANQTEPQLQLSNDDQEWNTSFAPFLRPFSPPVVYNDVVEGNIDCLRSNSDKKASYDRASERIEPPSRLAPANNMQEASAHVSYGEGGASKIRRPRRQNHSCDQCRSSKKACDLRLNIAIHTQKPSTPCSMCNGRGIECTVGWLARKQSAERAKRRLQTMSYHSKADKTADCTPTGREHTADTPFFDTLTSISSPEVDLVRQFAGRETCSQQFNLYVDVFDMPLSQCLSQGGMPPRYSLGVLALAPLSNSAHFSIYIDKANLWTESCWKTNSSSWASMAVAPHIFRTVSVLDSLFQRSGARRNCASPTPRDSSINEAYKWVAMATSAQFAAGKDERGDTGKADSWASMSRSRDIASVTWRIAKQMVFGNIAAISSFRLALSLLLFGLIPPPGPSEQRSAFEEDAEYALCEGMRRLQTLCSQARTYLLVNGQAGIPRCSIDTRNTAENPHSIQALPSDVREYVLELIGAIEWLITILNGVVIATSHGRIPLEMLNANASGLVQTSDADNLSVVRQHEQDSDDSILKRAGGEGQAFTTLWRNGTSDNILIPALRRLGSLAVLLSKSMARLTMVTENVHTGKADYNKIHRCYVTATKLIDLWRSAFGTFDGSATYDCEQLRPEMRRILAFCSNDADLTVLQFFEIAQRLEVLLALQPSTPAKERLCSVLQSTSAYRKEQRLVSAVQVSVLASTCLGMSTPGFQGDSGLKAHVQDIGAHPYPSMTVQVHNLAAKTFADELHGSITRLDTKRASEMTVGLESCLSALRGLEETLVTFPSLALTDEEAAVW